MPKSSYGYNTKSWNPVTGCSKLSAGCKNCWAEEYSHRMGWPWKVTLHPERLEQPFGWRGNQVIATAFMGDLFHEDVPDHFLDGVWAVMRIASQHTFLVLTKRPNRMKTYILARAAEEFPVGPRPNVFLGVSVENQQAADERIPELLKCPGKKWLSIDPMLGPVDLVREWFREDVVGVAGHYEFLLETFPGIDWLVVGGESGPNFRPCDPAWVHDVVDQCDAAGVPVHCKQGAGRWPGRQYDLPQPLWERRETAW